MLSALSGLPLVVENLPGVWRLCLLRADLCGLLLCEQGIVLLLVRKCRLSRGDCWIWERTNRVLPEGGEGCSAWDPCLWAFPIPALRESLFSSHQSGGIPPVVPLQRALPGLGRELLLPLLDFVCFFLLF